MVLKESNSVCCTNPKVLEQRNIPYVLMQIGNVNCILNLSNYPNIINVLRDKSGYFRVTILEKEKTPIMKQHMNMQIGKPQLNNREIKVTKNARILKDKRFNVMKLPVYDIVSMH